MIAYAYSFDISLTVQFKISLRDLRVRVICYSADDTPNNAVCRHTSCITTYRTVRIGVAYRLGTLGSADFLLGGVNRRKNDYQPFFSWLQVIRPNPEGMRSKSAGREVQIPPRQPKEKKLGTPSGVPSSFGCGSGI